jgi:large subunit ribosomal protein L3
MPLGIVGRKLGMTQVFDAAGQAFGVTVIEAGPCHVTQLRTVKKDGYAAVQLGFAPGKEWRLTQAESGHLGELPPYRELREFRVIETAGLSVGDEVRVETFGAGESVDVSAVAKGKGFAGVVKRHGFRGGPRTHGQSDRLRAPGSVGAGNSPSRVFKGTRMGGRMGGGRVTVRNLRIERVDQERNLLLLHGAVPGPRNTVVTIVPSRGTNREDS